jgi:hypothetical protein
MNSVQTGSCALRRGRVSQRNSVYHITTATYGRQPFFSAIAIGRCVVRALRAAEHEQVARTLAFLVAAARYIIGNPLRAGLVTRIGDYPLWDCVWVGAPVGAPSGAINLVENRG